MKLSIYTFFIILVLIVATKSFGQAHYFDYNRSLIDSIKVNFNSYCKNYVSSKPISKRSIKYDKRRIDFLNDFYEHDLTEGEIKFMIKKFDSHFRAFDTIALGATTKYQTQISAEGNLRISITYATFANEIVYKNIHFDTETHTNCKVDSMPMDLIDFIYLEKVCIPLIDFPLNCQYHSGVIQSDTVYFDKLRKLASPKYHFFLSQSEKALIYMTWFSTDTYKMDYVVKDMAELIKEERVETLVHLLYSPNIILSIYAMEGLTYLKEEKHVELDPESIRKMEEIGNSEDKIRWQYSDVVRCCEPYKNLKVNKQGIINKYGKIR